MNNRKFQIGSTKRRYQKSASVSCLYNRISAKLSLANLFSGAKKTFRRLIKVNWINLLKATKIIIEIAEKIRNLIFCEQSHLLLQGWV